MSNEGLNSPPTSTPRIMSKAPNILISASDPTESCSRTTKIDVLPRVPIIPGANQRFILPKGGVPLTQLVEREGQLAVYSDPQTQGYILSLDSDDFLLTNTNINNRKIEDLKTSLRSQSERNVKYGFAGIKRKAQGNSNTRLPNCCVCSAVPDPNKSHFDVFDDTTGEGNSFSDILVSILDSDSWDTLHQVSSVICNTCAVLADRIDRQRTQLNRDCSQLRDLYQSSQEEMEVDLLGEVSASPLETVSSLLSGCLVECRVLDISQGLVASSPDLSCPVLANHTLALGPARGQNASLYCTPLEWKEFSCDEERSLASLCGGCYMGLGPDKQSHTLTVLSSRVLEDLLVELDQEGPFLCADCDKTFSKLHLLMCHIQYHHGNMEEIDDENGRRIETKLSVSDSINEKTGEVPSLEKPFQCEACDKCFSNYSNMMSHVEHYHGWSRQCNVDTCQMRLSSIADFVSHHVQHSDANFIIPETNTERNSVPCKCPVCKKTSLGVNRHWEHSFIHDKVARFKCPLCDRRVNKVQNLKDHIKRHLGPDSKTKKCDKCDKKFCPADIYKHMKTVHGKQVTKYYCKICRKIFPLIHKLEHKN